MIEQSDSLGSLGLRQRDLQPDSLRPRYDVCITVASWESRATRAFEVLPPLQARWEVWRFASADEDSRTAKLRCFEALKSLRTEALERVELASSLNYERNFALIESRLRKARIVAGRPLDVLLDVTCLPKKYILFFLGSAVRNEFIRSIDFVYAEGAYSPLPDEESHAALTWTGSEGEWSSVLVPYLEAENYIPDARALVVALGAEISASVPFIERFEPMQIALISVDDDAQRINLESVEHERRLLRDLEDLPITELHTADLADVLGVARICQAFCIRHRDKAVTALAIGSKTHALALGLAALSVANLEVVCRLPSRYLSGDVVATGRVFHYTVEDRFEPRFPD